MGGGGVGSARSNGAGRHGVLVAAAVTAVAVLLTLLGAPPARSAGAAQLTGAATGLVSGARPNIILVTTDDQRQDELAWMPLTRRLLGGQGADFVNGISPHPLCCPARAEILTAKYAQNNGVRHNTGPWGGYKAFARKHRREHLATWLRNAGYNTGFVGKFMNGYSARHGDQPGWDKWSATLAGTYRYTKFTMRVDGRSKKYSLARNRSHYVADVVGDRGVSLARSFSRSRKPFFLWISHVAPHTARVDNRWVPPIPAPRHRTMFSGSRPQVIGQPHFREGDRSDKPREVRSQRAGSMERLLRSHRARIRSLQAVDEANARLIRALHDVGELDNTLVVFTSDNGYMQGEHHLWSKNWPYEETLRVPMLVRGPGVPAGVRRTQSATLVDLATTFLHAARAPRASSDGTNLIPALTQDAPTVDTTLIQAGAATTAGWRWRGVRTSRYVYVAWRNGDRELYDLEVDPYQMENQVYPHSGEPVSEAYRPVLTEMKRRYELLRGCSGASCRVDFGPVPEPVG